MAAMAYWRHRENIKRLLHGNERKTYLGEGEDLGAIDYLFITDSGDGDYKRWNGSAPEEGMRLYGFAVLEYDPTYQALDLNRIERDQWKIYSGELNNYKSKDWDKTGLEFVLYELIKGHKVVIDRQQIMFYKRQEKKEVS